MFCFESELCHSDLWGNSMLGTIVAIAIASIFGITAFVMILFFMRKCTNV
jgi:hypothetical protein